MITAMMTNMIKGKTNMESIEHCWVLLGKQVGPLWYGKLRKLSEGTPTRVAFDFRAIQDREERRHDVLGFFHTHPTFAATPSSIDDHTMKCWVASFGKPLICAIRGTDGLKVYQYIDDESSPLLCRYAGNIGNIMFGIDGDIEFDEVLDDDLAT